MTRQMVMVGFLQAQNCTNLPSSWRHPESRDDSMSADYYQEIGRMRSHARSSSAVNLYSAASARNLSQVVSSISIPERRRCCSRIYSTSPG